MEKKEPNYKVFIPLGITFLGSGIAFVRINPGMGISMIGLGVIWMAIGFTKAKNKKDESEK